MEGMSRELLPEAQTAQDARTVPGICRALPGYAEYGGCMEACCRIGRPFGVQSSASVCRQGGWLEADDC